VGVSSYTHKVLEVPFVLRKSTLAMVSRREKIRSIGERISGGGTGHRERQGEP